jgi:hypothetical protein
VCVCVCVCVCYNIYTHAYTIIINIVYLVYYTCILYILYILYIYSELCGDREVQRTMLELLNQLDGFSSEDRIKVCVCVCVCVCCVSVSVWGGA